MYISCGDDGTGVESEMGYVPNNPLFGMPLDSPQECPPTCAGCNSCQGGSALPLHALHGSDFDCGNCLDHNGVLSQPNLSGGYWTTDDMNTFTGLSPLDIDPLPSLFPFSPCGASYKTERPTHDMADVLLSLKHAVLKPSPEPQLQPQLQLNHSHHQQQQQQHNHHQQQHQQQHTMHHHNLSTVGQHTHHHQQHHHPHHHHQHGNYAHTTHPHQASLSYTVHPHQMLVATSPTLSGAGGTGGGSSGGSVHSAVHHQQLQQQQQQQQHQQMQSNGMAYGHHSAGIGGGGNGGGGGGGAGAYYDGTVYAPQHSPVHATGAGPLPPPPPPPQMYPSMSVNVSMNMTMHGYGGPEASVPMQCSQMQWTPQSSTPSTMNVLYPPLLSPNHHYPSGATYSFTADFRPPTTAQSMANTSANIGNGTVGSIGPNSGPMMMMDSMKMPSVGDAGGESPSQRSTGGFYHHSHHNSHQHHHGHHQTAAEMLGEYSPPHSPHFVQICDTKSFEALELELEDEEEDMASNEDGEAASDSKPNLCRLCGKTYARPSTLKTHLRTHSGERPYRCPDCNKSFSQAANLTAHVRTHTGQKPFRCPICDRRFSQSSSVTTHMRTHSGERPYRCRSCKKAFSDSSTLTKHLRIHSGEKPYQCKLCLLRFSQSGNLNRHMRVHGTNGNILT